MYFSFFQENRFQAASLPKHFLLFLSIAKNCSISATVVYKTIAIENADYAAKKTH